MIRVAGINKNDFVNGEGISVSLFLQGCPFQCEGCHNPETWDPEGGIAREEEELINEINEAICANGIIRNLSILGGEPLDTMTKREFLIKLFNKIKQNYPDIKICLWTGYTLEQLQKIKHKAFLIKDILNNTDYLIEGPFKINERDVTLKWRGSRNQRIIKLK